MLIKSVAYATEILQILKKIKQMDSFAVLNVSHRFHELHGFDTDKSLLLSVVMRTDW